MKRNFIVFLKAVVICSVCCFLLCLTLFMPNSTTLVTDDISNIPYTNNKENIYNILVELSEPKLLFTLKFNSKNQSLNVNCYPLDCATSAYEKFSKEDYIKSAEKLLNFFPKRRISLNSKNLCSIINVSGGITAPIPYGIPSSAGSGKIIKAEGPVHMYGHTVVQILSLTVTPQKEHLEYYAEIFTLVCKAFLSNFSEDKYLLLSKAEYLNISYTDYYDNKSQIENCFENLSYSAGDGVWMNDYYYLQ